MEGVKFNPIDIFIGNDENDPEIASKSLILLTGPNMGGKSTTLRMSCILAIMAQVGCWVPAKSLKMSLVD